MAEMKKKRQSRRAFLNEFHLNEKGEYVYEGKMIGFVEKSVTYRQYLKQTCKTAILIFIFTAAAECLPAVTMSKFGVTMISWLGQIIVACLVLYAIWRIFWGKNPMREYVYKASQEKLPTRALLMSFFSFFTAASETVFILVKGCGGEVLFTILRPIFSLICGLMSVYLYRLAKNTKWEQVEGNEN